MGKWFAAGLIFAGAVGIWAAIYYIRKKLKAYSGLLFGTRDLMAAARALIQSVEDPPRSLNACEGSVLPQVLRDFPDFDIGLTRGQVQDYLRKELGCHDGFQIHGLVLSAYKKDSLQRTLVFQAAISWLDGMRLQKRYDIHYTYALPQGHPSVAASCPNCGGNLGFGDLECPYCGTRVVNPLRQSWVFTRLQES